MSVFLLSVKGQVERVALPDHSELFLKYQFIYGEDWIVTTGIEEGITQVSQRYWHEYNEDFVFNFPLDVTFKSTNPRGWPQLVFCAYGRDGWGHEVLRGYGACHVPLTLGSEIEKVVGLFTPEASNVASRFATWISGRRPELHDPRILARNRGREVLRTSSKGCLHLKFNLLCKDMQRLDYTISSNHPATISEFVQPERDSVASQNAITAVTRGEKQPGSPVAGVRNRRRSSNSASQEISENNGVGRRSDNERNMAQETVIEEVSVIKRNVSDDDVNNGEIHSVEAEVPNAGGIPLRKLSFQDAESEV